MTELAPRAAVVAAAVALFLVGGAYQVKGNLDLIAGQETSSAIDIKNRDTEHELFVRGQNPFDSFEASQPPWGYPFGLLLTAPEWPAVRVYFAVINALALAVLMWWAYREPRMAPPHVRWLLAGAVFAFGGSCTATEVGQVSIVVTALLAGALMLDRMQRQAAAGLLVALALIKPTIAAPFAVALLVAGRYRAAAAAAAYGAAACAFTWSVTGALPHHMLQQMAAGAAKYAGAGTLGLNDVLAAAGVVSAAQVALAPLIVTVPAMALMAMARQSLTLSFAVAAVWGRLWTYHKSYDDVMLAFLLIPLGVLALVHRSRAASAAFVLVGAVSWIPGRLLAVPEIQMLQLVAWPAALAVLVVSLRGGFAVEVQRSSSERLERLHA
jgi:hypothetical protein